MMIVSAVGLSDHLILLYVSFPLTFLLFFRFYYYFLFIFLFLVHLSIYVVKCNLKKENSMFNSQMYRRQSFFFTFNFYLVKEACCKIIIKILWFFVVVVVVDRSISFGLMGSIRITWIMLRVLNLLTWPLFTFVRYLCNRVGTTDLNTNAFIEWMNKTFLQ